MLDEFTKESGLTDDVIRKSSPINDYSFIDLLAFDQLVESLPAGLISQGVFGVSGTNEGIQTSVDKSNGVGYLQSRNYVSGTTGWRVDSNGNGEFASITLTGGTLRYQKTSFTDSTNAGWILDSNGIYFGAASDATKLKFTIGTGAFDFIGTISSRSTATIASAIDSSGDLVNDIINARLDSSAKTILSDFNFGAVNYAGAVKAGDITWNTTTGAITGGSGVVVYRGGIVGAATGVTTFSLDASTGNATFAGTLSAAAGTLGTITAGTLNGLTITGGTVQTASSGARIVASGATNQLILYNASGVAQITLGDVGTGSATQTISVSSSSKTGLSITDNDVDLADGDYLLNINVTRSGTTHAVLWNHAGDGIAYEFDNSGTNQTLFIQQTNGANNQDCVQISSAGTGASLKTNNYFAVSNNAIANAAANDVNIGAADISAGNTTLAFRTEGTGVVGSGTPAQNRTVAMVVNGTTYYLLASTSAS